MWPSHAGPDGLARIARFITPATLTDDEAAVAVRERKRASSMRVGVRSLSISGYGRRLVAPLPRSASEELLDRPSHEPAELAANLRDIRRVNRIFGGTSTVLRHLPRLLSDLSADRPVTVLDLATGSADIPLALSRWADANRRRLRITASDVSDEILAAARQHVAGRPDITLARCDARAVPFADGSFDVVLCSLALHHFAPDEAILVLREMDRIARRGFIVNDLTRSRIGLGAAWIAARLTTRNRLTRHDAPLSVRRAYTPDELTELLRRAGIDGATVVEHAWFRMAAIKVTSDAHA